MNAFVPGLYFMLQLRVAGLFEGASGGRKPERKTQLRDSNGARFRFDAMLSMRNDSDRTECSLVDSRFGFSYAAVDAGPLFDDPGSGLSSRTTGPKNNGDI